jgi:hypothetical protein
VVGDLAITWTQRVEGGHKLSKGNSEYKFFGFQIREW